MTPSRQEIEPATMPFRPSVDRQVPANPRSVLDTMPRQCVSFSTHFSLDSVFPVPLFEGLPDSPTRLEIQDWGGKVRLNTVQDAVFYRFYGASALCPDPSGIPFVPGNRLMVWGLQTEGQRLQTASRS